MGLDALGRRGFIKISAAAGGALFLSTATGCAPSLMVGIRIGFSIAFINVIIAEFFAARAGLGLLALRAYGMLDLPTMYGIIVLLAAIALAGNLALWAVERRLGEKA